MVSLVSLCLLPDGKLFAKNCKWSFLFKNPPGLSLLTSLQIPTLCCKAFYGLSGAVFGFSLAVVVFLMKWMIFGKYAIFIFYNKTQQVKTAFMLK